MTGFVKAVPLASPLKLSGYGPPGSGKSFTGLLFAEGLAAHRKKRVAYIDTEFSTKTYRAAVPARRIHPEAFDFDVLDTRSLDTALSLARKLDPEVHGVVVVDTITRFWDAAREAYAAKNPEADDIPLRAWSSIKRPYKDFMQFLMQSPFDVILLGRQKTLFDQVDGKLESIGVGMRAEGETQYEPDICLRFEMVGRRGEEEGVVTMFAEKDRYGILSGRTFPRPNFKTIEPLLPYLGTATPASETDEEAAAQDAGLLVDGEEKAKLKAEKSAGMLADLQVKIQSATTVEDLGKAGAEIKKVKRYLTDEHTAAIKVLFESRRDTLVAQTAGSV